MDKKLEASPGRGLASEEIEHTTGSKTPLNCTSPTELSTPQLRQYQVEVIEQCRQRPEGTSRGRVYCRNPKCRCKLKDANIALATGKRSGTFVVDIDGASAENALTKLEAEHGALPATTESITARGRHLFFTCPDQPVIKNSVSEIAPGIDTRCEGGYVIVPPSVHSSGHIYIWKNGVERFAPAPIWLLAKISGRKSGLHR
jgi:hypothetical protein